MKTVMYILCACLLCVIPTGCQGQPDATQNPQVKKDNPPLPVIPPPYVKIEAFGKLTVGVRAIGGETTGYVITAKGQTWELDFYKDDNLIVRAKELDGQLVFVRGTPELRRKVERGIVPTILVDDLKDTSHILPKKKS